MALDCVVQLSGMTKSAFSRMTAPQGTLPAALPAEWRAGHSMARDSALSRRVTRKAWRMSPDEASAARSRKGVMGRPAASAEVQFAGRRASDLRSQAAEDSVYHCPDSLYEK